MKNISTEMIDYQLSDKFPGQLAAIYERAIAKWEDGHYRNGIELMKDGFGDEICKLIKKRFNLNIVMIPELIPDSFAAILPFCNDTMSLQTSERSLKNMKNASAKSIKGGVSISYNEDDCRAYLKANEEAFELMSKNKVTHQSKGTVDFKRVYVTGYLSEVRHILLIDIPFMVTMFKASAMEMVAITIHEIGHAFTGLVTHHQMVTTNMAITDILNALNENRMDVAEYVWTNNFGKEEFLAGMIDSSSTIADYNAAIAMKITTLLESQYQNNTYDATMSEFMADNFMARFGLGAEQSRLLVEFYNYDKEAYRNLRALNTIGFIGSVMMIAATAIGMTIATGNPIIGFLTLAATIFWKFFSVISKGSKHYKFKDYDHDKDRISRLKRDAYNSLKNLKLPNETVKAVLASIKMMESYEKVTTNDNRVGFSEKLALAFSETLRKNQYYKNKQQEIEKLLNSRLFATSAKLRLLGES